MRKFLLFLFFVFIALSVFALPQLIEDGIRITEPVNGTVVTPGQTITIMAENNEGFIAKFGWIDSYFFTKPFETLPISFEITIPAEAIGEIHLGGFAGNKPENETSDVITSCEIVLPVQVNATLQSIQVSPETLSFDIDWNGNVIDQDSFNAFGSIEGIFSDGITRDLFELGVVFTSSDPSVVSIDGKGRVTGHKKGDAIIAVSYSGVTKEVPVVFRTPTGIRPSETIPPTCQIDIQPGPNAQGWYKNDLTITLTAQDNEGGAGIRDIFYEFPYISADSNDIPNTIVVIPFSTEGINLMRYGATDKEGNDTGQLTTEIKLDKTPPSLTISANPNTLWPPNNKMVDVTINGNAGDSLAGIESLTFTVKDEYGKCQPALSKFGSSIKLEASREGDDKDGRIYTITVIAKDKAGNESTASTTVTVPHDKGKN